MSTHRREPNPSPRERSALDWPQQAGVADEVRREVERHVASRRQRTRARLRLGTAALLLMAGLGLTWRTLRVEPSATPAASVTVSVPARQVLADGTVVELNSDAEIHPDFTATLRRVVLTRGEAHFQVTKDPQRPFVVVAGKVEVRAVGTAFAVQIAPAAVDVLVTEGTVAVEHVQLPSAPPLAMVAAGRRTSVDVATVARPAAPAPAVVNVTPAEMADRLAWRVPQIEFSATPLREVVNVFNRYSSVRLVLAESALGELCVSGIVRADNTAALRQLLQTEFGIRVEPRGEHEWILARGR